MSSLRPVNVPAVVEDAQEVRGAARLAGSVMLPSPGIPLAPHAGRTRPSPAIARRTVRRDSLLDRKWPPPAPRVCEPCDAETGMTERPGRTIPTSCLPLQAALVPPDEPIPDRMR